MRFLRTASTARLLAVIAGVVSAMCAVAAIAVAATSGGPVPRPSSLPRAVHRALGAAPVAGVSADITFTDDLVDSTDLSGQPADPLLQGASGRLWADGSRLRVELQSDDGDAQIVVDGRRLWVSDPAQDVVYEATLPASPRPRAPSPATGVPSLARIETALARLAHVADVSGAQPTDVGDRAAYRVTLSPRPASGGLLGAVSVAFDAVHGVPLSFDVYARGDAQPVLGLTATHVAYGTVPASAFAIVPPAGARVVGLGALGAPDAGRARGLPRGVTGVRRVAARLPIALHPPRALAGLTRVSTRLVSLGGVPAALISYGHGLGAITVIESRAVPGAEHTSGSTGGLSLPTRRIGGAVATVLSTPLGTVLHLDRGGISYTVLGSLTAATAQRAADGLF